MTILEKFKSINSETLDQKRGPVVIRKKIIKRQSVELNAPVKISADRDLVRPNKKTAVTPILEEGEIVGILHQCACGEKSEIYFELEEELNHK